jgi:hypothetical protein
MDGVRANIKQTTPSGQVAKLKSVSGALACVVLAAGCSTQPSSVGDDTLAGSASATASAQGGGAEAPQARDWTVLGQDTHPWVSTANT